MARDPSTGAMDDRVGLDDQLRPDVDYRRPGARHLLDLVGDIAEKRILDIGCGLGPDRSEVERRGGTWVGVELTGPGCTVVGDADQLPFPDGVFDGVLCSAVLEHMPEPGQTMAEANRVLADGGLFFGYVSFLEPFHGISYFHMTHAGLEHLLIKHGFQPVRIFAPFIGAAYQTECMLFPRHVPVIRPLFRTVSQACDKFLLFCNRALRRMVFALSGRPEARDAENHRRYRELLDLRFAIGFNFIARKDATASSQKTGYRSLARDG